MVLFGHLLAVTEVMAVGGITASAATEAYQELDLPPYAPPAWLFPPAWITLYVLMAVAAWRAWRAAGFDRAQVLYVAQLLLNLAWMPLFFAADLHGLALAEIAVLWCAIAATMVLFWRRDRIAGLLMGPYLGWVGYTSALNGGIVVLN
ncbi:tryptophan-rich sensory protein [Nocardioides sp. GY 10113]|uniref:TspO/MBR family protein n=1 Tax=Nocardioides sp. GY 10113 TaxID=2569761 RepID=UPI0010A7CDC6|nr:TspO/MBR family protein [Nocardioides sp. GY 10113]TIC85125.1 tryptophan-rich sensory protein [Nocardioides sp. GY 10113]